MAVKKFDFILVKKSGEIEFISAKLEEQDEYSVVEYAEHLIKAGYSKVFSTPTLGDEWRCVEDITYGTDGEWKFHEDVYEDGLNSVATKLTGKKIHGDCVIMKKNSSWKQNDETNNMFESVTKKDLNEIVSRANKK